jgi:hypothetical protein
MSEFDFPKRADGFYPIKAWKTCVSFYGRTYITELNNNLFVLYFAEAAQTYKSEDWGFSATPMSLTRWKEEKACQDYLKDVDWASPDWQKEIKIKEPISRWKNLNV